MRDITYVPSFLASKDFNDPVSSSLDEAKLPKFLFSPSPCMYVHSTYGRTGCSSIRRSLCIWPATMIWLGLAAAFSCCCRDAFIGPEIHWMCLKLLLLLLVVVVVLRIAFCKRNEMIIADPHILSLSRTRARYKSQMKKCLCKGWEKEWVTSPMVRPKLEGFWFIIFRFWMCCSRLRISEFGSQLCTIALPYYVYTLQCSGWNISTTPTCLPCSFDPYLMDTLLINDAIEFPWPQIEI